MLWYSMFFFCENLNDFYKVNFYIAIFQDDHLQDWSNFGLLYYPYIIYWTIMIKSSRIVYFFITQSSLCCIALYVLKLQLLFIKLSIQISAY